MNLKELVGIIENCINDVTFSINEKPCGITSTVDKGIPTFEVWCGDFVKSYNDVNVLIEDKVFLNHSLRDIVGCTQFNVI